MIFNRSKIKIRHFARYLHIKAGDLCKGPLSDVSNLNLCKIFIFKDTTTVYMSNYASFSYKQDSNI